MYQYLKIALGMDAVVFLVLILTTIPGGWNGQAFALLVCLAIGYSIFLGLRRNAKSARTAALVIVIITLFAWYAAILYLVFNPILLILLHVFALLFVLVCVFGITCSFKGIREIAGGRVAVAVILSYVVLLLVLYHYSLVKEAHGRIRLTNDPQSVRWNLDSSAVLYVDGKQGEDGIYRNILHKFSVKTRKRESYRLPDSNSGVSYFDIRNNKVIYFDELYRDYPRHSRSRVYVVDMKTGEIRRIYSNDQQDIGGCFWLPRDRVAVVLKSNSYKLSWYSIRLDGRELKRIYNPVVEHMPVSEPPKREVSPNGEWYWELERRGGSDWYNSRPSPLWLGKMKKIE